MSENEPDILSMLGRHELALKQLYEVFAARFPKYESFWKILVSDEQKHSDWIEAFRVGSTVAGSMQGEIPFKPQAIQSSTGYVEQQTQKAREGGFRLIQALSIAKDLENALIERLFSKLSRSDSREVRSIIADLTDETEKHRDMLAKALEIEKRGNSQA